MHTNDPRQAQVRLQISGFVENFVTITPAYVRLTGPAGQPVSVPVTIVPEEKYPFRILDASATSGVNIRYEIRERSSSEGKGYTLIVENVKMNAGRYHDIIRLKTDSSIKPEIDIRVFGFIHDKKPRQSGS